MAAASTKKSFLPSACHALFDGSFHHVSSGMTAQVSCALEPCRHHAFCLSCSERLISLKQICPLHGLFVLIWQWFYVSRNESRSFIVYLCVYKYILSCIIYAPTFSRSFANLLEVLPTAGDRPDSNFSCLNSWEFWLNVCTAMTCDGIVQSCPLYSHDTGHTCSLFRRICMF